MPVVVGQRAEETHRGGDAVGHVARQFVELFELAGTCLGRPDGVAGELCAQHPDHHDQHEAPAQGARQGEGQSSTQATNFKVVVTLEEEVPDVRPGFTCTAEITTATRTNVVLRPWRCRRMSSAAIPSWMMSWVEANAVSSASLTVIPTHDHIKQEVRSRFTDENQDTGGVKTRPRTTAIANARTHPVTQTATARAVLR